MITELTLENWKSHSSSSFSFGKGTNVLLGRMGAGKSSVLDALCFALYGTFPKMSRRDQSTESVVNIASGAEAAGVTLTFERQGKKYEVMRRVGKKTAEAEARLEAGRHDEQQRHDGARYRQVQQVQRGGEHCESGTDPSRELLGRRVDGPDIPLEQPGDPLGHRTQRTVPAVDEAADHEVHGEQRDEPPGRRPQGDERGDHDDAGDDARGVLVDGPGGAFGACHGC